MTTTPAIGNASAGKLQSLRLVGVLLALITASGCSDTAFPPEILSKLRPLGSQTTPVAITPGQNVQLIIHLATPDAAARISVTDLKMGWDDAVNVTTQTSVIDVATYATLSHKQIVVEFELPQLPATITLGEDGVAVPFQLTADDGNAPIPMRGLFKIYPSGHSATALKAPELVITEPGERVRNQTDNPLRVNLTKAQEEAIKVSWLVPHGRVQNRRAQETKWRPDGASGTHTIVVSARGRESQAMSVVFKDVMIE